MKPLTIEELQFLQPNDYVWIEDLLYEHNDYWRIESNNDTVIELYQSWIVFGVYYYEDYGSKWIAYKNKEQAEAKGEIVELPVKKGDTVYTVSCCFYDKQVGDELESEAKLEVTEDVLITDRDLYKFMLRYIRKMGFLTKPEAEERLKELRGE